MRQIDPYENYFTNLTNNPAPIPRKSQKLSGGKRHKSRSRKVSKNHAFFRYLKAMKAAKAKNLAQFEFDGKTYVRKTINTATKKYKNNLGNFGQKHLTIYKLRSN